MTERAGRRDSAWAASPRIFELRQGLSVKKIGKALGIAAWTVSRYVRSFEEGDR